MSEIAKYIKEARTFGQPDEQIKSVLLHQGWKADDIDLALRHIRPEAPLPPESKLTFGKQLKSVWSVKGVAAGLVVGTVLMLIGGWMYAQERGLQERGIEAPGIVAQIDREQVDREDSEGHTYKKTVYVPTFTFQDADGTARRFKGQGGSYSSYTVGAQVTVLYDPQDRQNVRIKGKGPMLYILGFMLSGGALLILSLLHGMRIAVVRLKRKDEGGYEQRRS